MPASITGGADAAMGASVGAAASHAVPSPR